MCRCVCTHYKTTNLDTVHPTALSSLSETSCNLTTAPQSAHSLSHTALSSNKSSGHPTTSLHSFLPKQHGSQDSSLSCRLQAPERVTTTPSLFLPTRSPSSPSSTSHSLHLTVIHRCPYCPQRKFYNIIKASFISSQQLVFSPICWCTPPIILAVQRCNSTQPRAINELPGQPPTAPLWHTCHDKRRISCVSLCPLLLPFRAPF